MEFNGTASDIPLALCHKIRSTAFPCDLTKVAGVTPITLPDFISRVKWTNLEEKKRHSDLWTDFSQLYTEKVKCFDKSYTKDLRIWWKYKVSFNFSAKIFEGCFEQLNLRKVYFLTKNKDVSIHAKMLADLMLLTCRRSIEIIRSLSGSRAFKSFCKEKKNKRRKWEVLHPFKTVSSWLKWDLRTYCHISYCEKLLSVTEMKINVQA